MAQPQAHAEALSLRLSARAITWEPEGLVVELVLLHEGEQPLTVDPALVFLAYDGLEYAPVVDEETDAVVLARGDERAIELEYSLGRALTGPGAALRLRGVRGPEEPVVELIELPIPAMPVQARPH
jgi:hypothetical protein